MKYLIVGLGNIGDRYAGTRHNIGFDILDCLASKFRTVFEEKRLGYHASFSYKARHIHLLKPTTYMNLSGGAVRYWQQALQVPHERLLVVTDDLHLPLGQLRIRPKGRSGGHNGMAHIEKMLGTHHFPRLRCGIGAQFPYGEQGSYVLGRFTIEELSMLKAVIPLAGEAIEAFCVEPLSVVMGRYNGHHIALPTKEGVGKDA